MRPNKQQEEEVHVEQKRQNELQSLRLTSESLMIARETVQTLSEQSGRLRLPFYLECIFVLTRARNARENRRIGG